MQSPNMETLEEPHATAVSMEPPAASQHIVLSDEQEQVITAAIEEESNLLVLGKAGVGKSTTLRELFARLENLGKQYLCLAPTGVAAINVGGQTIHRMIGKLTSMPRLHCDLIVIDEVSMVRADLLDDLDNALRVATMNTKPFGGIKIMLFGDPGQLPPVLQDGGEKDNIEDNYFSEFFFSSAAYARGNFKVMELSKVFRQKDNKYPQMLNLIREGKTEKPVAWINKFRVTNEPRGVILASTNKDAAMMNTEQLNKLKEVAYNYRAQKFGPWQPNEYPAEELITLKQGARVMCIKNIYRGDDEDNPRSMEIDLVNGDVGIIQEITNDGIVIECARTGKQHPIFVKDGNWNKEDVIYDRTSRKLRKEVVGNYVQLPVRLAYAITIHKSQGATIEELTIDLRRKLFAPGQAYVAFSRGVTLEKLWIMGRLRPTDIMVHPAVRKFLADSADETIVGIKPGSCFDMKEVETQSAPSGVESFDEMFK